MTDKLRQAAEETVKKLEHISRKLEGHRVWGGMKWEYHAILPSQYLPLRDFIDSQIRALRKALDQLPDTTKMMGLIPSEWAGLEEPPNSATDVVEDKTYNGWVLRNVYFEDGEPLMHSEPESTRLQELAATTPNLVTEIKRLQELADYRLKLLTKMPSEWVGLTDEEILAITFDAKITEPNDEPIKFGAPSRKCIKDLVSGVETKLKEKNT